MESSFLAVASVHDKSDWQLVLSSMLNIANDIPILGICFGHQFLAHNLGGRVDYLWNKEKKRVSEKFVLQIVAY